MAAEKMLLTISAKKLSGKGNVAVLRSYVGIPIDLERYNGFAEELAAKYPDIKIVVEGDGRIQP